MSKRLGLIALVLALAASSLWYFTQLKPAPDTPPSLALAADMDTTGFAKAEAPIPFEFPNDHGPHFDFQTEWWYYTGNLNSPAGDHYGYQLTIFRRGLTPGAPQPNA